MTITDAGARARLLRTGFVLEWITLGWNIMGVAVLAYLALTSSSTALAGFGLDSLAPGTDLPAGIGYSGAAVLPPEVAHDAIAGRGVAARLEPGHDFEMLRVGEQVRRHLHSRRPSPATRRVTSRLERFHVPAVRVRHVVEGLDRGVRSTNDLPRRTGRSGSIFTGPGTMPLGLATIDVATTRELVVGGSCAA